MIKREVVPITEKITREFLDFTSTSRMFRTILLNAISAADKDTLKATSRFNGRERLSIESITSYNSTSKKKELKVGMILLELTFGRSSRRNDMRDGPWRHHVIGLEMILEFKNNTFPGRNKGKEVGLVLHLGGVEVHDANFLGELRSKQASRGLCTNFGELIVGKSVTSGLGVTGNNTTIVGSINVESNPGNNGSHVEGFLRKRKEDCTGKDVRTVKRSKGRDVTDVEESRALGGELEIRWIDGTQ